MKIITINLSERYLNAIKVLTDLGVYPSRSEAIRVALSDFLKDEINMYEELNEENFELIVRSSLKHRD